MLAGMNGRLRPLRLTIIVALAASLYGWAVFATTFRYPGILGIDYLAPGTDWMVVYTAVRLALTHQLALAHDGHAYTDYLNQTYAAWLSHPLYFRPWVYPPSLLVLLAPFGVLGFLGAYLTFQVATGAALAAGLCYRPSVRDGAAMAAIGGLICPAASINVVDGQFAFFVAAVLVWGFRLMSVRPWIGGVVLGLLSVKPQFALLVPVALLAAREWRGLAATALSAIGLAAASALIFGVDLWTDWFAQMSTLSEAPDQSNWAMFGRLWGNSVFACAVHLGLPTMLANLLQYAAILAAAASVYAAYRTRPAADPGLAVLLAAAILAAPHSGTYDGVLLTVAALLWLAEQPKPRMLHGIVVLMLWLSPLMGPPAIAKVGCFIPLLIGGFILAALGPRAEARAPAPIGP
jgi:alpha-1,2-mannosyltransferase